MGGYRKTDPETSRLAFEEMDRRGLLSKGRMEIAREMACAEASLTAGELACRIGGVRNNVATRLSEMEQLGVVAKDYEGICEYSKRTCWKWRLTGRLPSKKPKQEERMKPHVAIAELTRLAYEALPWLPPLVAKRIETDLERIKSQTEKKR